VEDRSDRRVKPPMALPVADDHRRRGDGFPRKRE
jgi:hypothetical protein